MSQSARSVKPVVGRIDSLHLQQFTSFAEVEFAFGHGINALVGENGTGKTHAMKVLYAWMLTQSYKDARSIGFLGTLLRTMQTELEAKLVRFGSAEGKARIDLKYGGREWAAVLQADDSTPRLRDEHVMSGVERPVFIPAVDMMGHARGFVGAWDESPLDFDYTYRDIAHLLSLEKRAPSPHYLELITKLENILDGTVEYDSKERRFYLVRDKFRQEMPMVAEGLRKIATLLVLLRNGSIKHGTTLFWDEPEVNINPILMDELIRALLEISRSGVQIILATHSYVILKELDLQASKTDHIRFFALELSEGGTAVHPTDHFAQLNPNSILDQYGSLYDREITHALGGGPRANRH